MTAIRPGSPASRPTVTGVASAAPRTTDALSPRDAAIFRYAGVLTLLAAALIGAGSFVPWVTHVLASGVTQDVNAYQFGAGETWTWFGPIILGCACLLAISGVMTLFHPWRPNVCMPFLPTVFVGLEMADQWHGGFGGVTSATTTLGAGSYLCFAGIVVGVVASALLLPAERPRIG